MIPKVSLKSHTVEVNAKPSLGWGEGSGGGSGLKEQCHCSVSTCTCGGSAGDQKGRGAGKERGRGGGLAQMNFDFQPPAEVFGGEGRGEPAAVCYLFWNRRL